MALVLKDRVKELTSTTGTGSFALAGAVTGYDSFSQIGNGNTTYYAVYLDGGSEWEVGIGTYTAPSTLSRDTVLASSASGAKVSFSSGQKSVWCDYPAGKAVFTDALGNISRTIGDISAVTGGISTPDFVQFDTTATPTIALGKERWNVDTGTLAFGIIDGTQEVQIGQQMYALVHNAEAVTITKGQVVYLFGATGNKASVKLANNTGDATSAKTFGLAAQDISAGGTGFVITAGVLDKLNTGSFNEGDTLYLGATAGSYTATKPKAPNHLVYVGIVERANNGNGQIYVRVQNGYELDEIHDVQINSPSNGQTILYDASTSLWKNANLTAGTGVSVTNGPASVSIANTGVTGLTAGTAISVSGSTGNVTVTNTAPDQTVAIASGTGISVTGTYPNFTVTNTSPSSGGTVTSITAGTGLTGGTITTSGTIAIDSTVATLTGSQTLQNKTLDNTNTVTLSDALFTLQDDADPTKQANFQLSGITTGNTRTYTLPNLTGSLATIGNLAQTFAGNTAFSNATASFGTSTAAGTYTLGSGATISGATRTINIGNAGVAGSTTAITIGGTANTTTVTANGTWTYSTPLANSNLANSSITINGSSVSLGGSTTVTATATNALTIGAGLTGTSYNGSTAVTIAVDSTVVRTNGSYSDPTWITSLDGSKITGTLDGGSF